MPALTARPHTARACVCGQSARYVGEPEVDLARSRRL